MRQKLIRIFHSGVVTRPLSALLRLATMGCPALRAPAYHTCKGCKYGFTL